MGKLNNVEIKNRIVKINDGLPDFFMVQLYVDGKPINNNAEPISNYDFWESMLEQSQRAIYRIKKNNPNMSFDFSLSQNKEEAFIKFLKERYPDLDIDNLLNLFDEEIKTITFHGPDDNHPNPEIRFPINSELFKNVFISLCDKLNKK